jgi:enoyl-CoA hydratase
MVRLGAELAVRVLGFPYPVVTACPGHAYPMGAFLLLASDIRIGADGPYRIGLNEVAIGIPVPTFGLPDRGNAREIYIGGIAVREQLE